MDFQSTDPNFRVSWLLGLRPYRRVAVCPDWTIKVDSRPEWAKDFETDDPGFFVSYLLGIKPRPDSPSEAARKALQEEVKWDVFGLRLLYGNIPDREAILRETIEEDKKWDIHGLRKLFGDLPFEPAEESETTTEESDESTEEEAVDSDPTLATPEFLTLCEDLEVHIDDIEAR